MQTYINGVCRGSGKVFVRICASELDHDHSLDITAQTKAGDDIPSKIYETLLSKPDFRTFVAVFPVLTTPNGSFTVSETDGNGNVLSSETHALSFTKAKWKSRINYRLNKKLCNEIRNYDRIGKFNEASLEFWECIPDNDSIILRGVIRLPYKKNSNVTLECMTEKLHTLDIAPVYLNNAVVRSPILESSFLREIQFSVRLPHCPQNLIFTVADDSHPEFNNFEALELSSFETLLSETQNLMLNAQVDPLYSQWFEKQKVDLGTLAKQTDTFFEYRPVFSIVVPLFNTPESFFSEMLSSIASQSYGRWELILVNASPDNESLATLVKEATLHDDRIKAIALESNLGISENTNAGIAAASGDFVSFFDHDDVLEPNLFFEYAKALNKFDDVDLLYCDEDKLMPDGTLTSPFLKPDFSIDLLRNNNYICHLLTIRKSLLDQIEWSTKEFDGAQDHNLTLLAVEHARRVFHVPQVLYHWRLSENSTAANADSKPYATKAGIKAVQNHLDRLGIRATVGQSRRPFTYSIAYDIPDNKPLVSIIIPSKDHSDILNACVTSIFEKSSYDNFEVVVIENNSIDQETFELYERLKTAYRNRIRVEYWPHEFNFSKIINFGAEKARGDYLLLLNNDTEVITPSWIETMLGLCAREEVGAVGVRLLYKDETIQHAGVCVTGGVAGHLHHNLPKGNWGYFALADATQNLSAVTAACMMTKRNAFAEVNGFSEELAVAFNDIDYCLKLREKGFLIVYTPEVELFHYESLSRGSENNITKQIRFHREYSYMNYRWAEYYIKGDPYINPNITSSEPFNCYYRLA